MRNKTFGKRRIFTALSIMTLLVLILTAFVGCSAKNVDVKKVDGIDAALGDKAFVYMQTLSTQYADRTLGGGNDFEFAKYLSKTMLDIQASFRTAISWGFKALRRRSADTSITPTKS